MTTSAHSSKDITAALELLQEIRRTHISRNPSSHSWNREHTSKLTLAIDCLDDCLCEATEREEAGMDEARREEEDRVIPYDRYTGSGAGR